MLGLIVSGTFFGSGKRLSGEVVPPVREGGEIYGRSTGRQTGTRHATCTFAHITADSTFTQFNADVCTMKRRRTKAGAASPGRAAPAAAAAVAAVLLAFLFQSSTAVAAAGAAAATWQSRAGGPAGQMLHAIRFVPQGVAEAAAAATQNAACKRSKKLAGREHIVRGARSSSQAAGAGSPTAGKDRKRFLQRQQEPVPTVDRAASRTTTQRGRPLALWRRFDRRSKLSPAGRLDDDAAEPHVLYAAAAGNDGYDGEETASDPQRQGSSTSEAAAKRSRGGGEIHLNFREGEGTRDCELESRCGRLMHCGHGVKITYPSSMMQSASSGSTCRLGADSPTPSTCCHVVVGNQISKNFSFCTARAMWGSWVGFSSRLLLPTLSRMSRAVAVTCKAGPSFVSRKSVSRGTISDFRTFIGSECCISVSTTVRCYLFW